MLLDDKNLPRRTLCDLQDDGDEALELELFDLYQGLREGSLQTHEERLARQRYFHTLFSLQAELVKLHNWVVKTGHKVVILFEGRDAAGKGGVIKRIT